MYLTRLLINPQDPCVRRDLADCQRMHRTIMNAFPAVASGPARAQLGALYRVDRGVRPGTVTVYVQSLTEPDWTKLPPGYLSVADDSAACRPVDDVYDAISAGDDLAFRLRANVTRKIDTKSAADGARRNGRRVELRHEPDQLAWLDRHAAQGGFAIVEATTRSGRVTGVHPEGTLAFGSVYFLGILRVTDSRLFRQTLADGIGPAKAYGFGLLSVAPAGTRVSTDSESAADAGTRPALVPPAAI